MGRVTFVSIHPGRVVAAQAAIQYTKDEALCSDPENGNITEVPTVGNPDRILFQLEYIDEDVNKDIVIDLDQKTKEFIDGGN